MARGSFFAGIMTSTVLGAALFVGLAAPAYAQDAPPTPPKLTLTGSASFTTDYMFRSVSNTSQNPAVQPEFDLTYGMWWAYIWGSNTSLSDKGIEIDYGGGISPKWQNFTFTVGGLEYTYPSDTHIDYFELKTGVSWNPGAGPWTLSVNNWWSPNNFGLDTQSDALELGAGYAFPKYKLFNFFAPSISGVFGWQWYEKTDVVPDYTYGNVGLTLTPVGSLKNWSGDIRFYDTSYNKEDCFINSGGRNNCDARAVGTIKVTF